MKYGEAVKKSMEMLAEDNNTIFLGYNTAFGSNAYNTLKDIPREKKLETPLAENLMMGLAMGMSLEGFRPILFFERHDFILIALDGIVNHLDKIKKLSKGQYEMPVIIRAVVGSKVPIDPGLQHIQDFSDVLKNLVNFPVYEPKTPSEVIEVYEEVKKLKGPVMVIEQKELYDLKEISQNNGGKLVLDGHKLFNHKDRVKDWMDGKRVAPITIDMALTQACNYKCVYCYGQLQKNEEGHILTKEILFKFLDDAAEIGVKAISLVSDGESTCSPHFYNFISYCKQKRIDIAVATNGSLLKEEKLREMLSALTYLRFNMSAGEPERYAEIMGTTEENFHKVCNNIKKCVQIKKENNFDVTIGLQMVLMPDFKDQIIPLTKLGKELGVDYLVIKHCSDDELGSIGVDYSKYAEMESLLKESETYSTENYFVKAKWSKIKSGGGRKYTKCYGPPLMLQISGSGLIAPCGSFFNPHYKRYWIGYLAEKSFKEIWQSERYWEVMDILASDKFNAKTDCASLCLQHKVNEFLWDLKRGDVSLDDCKITSKPMHINFI